MKNIDASLVRFRAKVQLLARLVTSAKPPAQADPPAANRRAIRIPLVVAVAVVAATCAGCGGGGAPPPAPQPTGMAPCRRHVDAEHADPEALASAGWSEWPARLSGRGRPNTRDRTIPSCSSTARSSRRLTKARTWQWPSINRKITSVIRSWGDSSAFNYDKWLVRWDKDGHYAGQQEINSFVDRTVGFARIQPFASGTYGASVEGCDNGATSSQCRQGWTVRATVNYVSPQPLNAGCRPHALVQ